MGAAPMLQADASAFAAAAAALDVGGTVSMSDIR